MAEILRGTGLVLLLLGVAAPLRAQKTRWTDAVYATGRWDAGRLAPPAGADSLALLMRAEVFSHPPRWRAEISRTANGTTFGEPVVLLGDRASVLVVTPLGATPLAQHELARDPLIALAAAAFTPQGTRRDAPSGRIAVRDAAGTARVVFRRPARIADFSDDMLNPRNRSAGRRLLASNLERVGDQRNAEVVATAGARGVDRVRTPGGEVAVTPDTLAVLAMERRSVDGLVLENFLRTGGLGPYRAGPP